MSTTIQTTFVISIRYKDKMLIALEETNGRYDFVTRKLVDPSESSGVYEVKRFIQDYIQENIAPLVACRVNVKIHELLDTGRVSVGVVVFFKDQFKLNNAALVTPKKASKMNISDQVSVFLSNFFSVKEALKKEQS